MKNVLFSFVLFFAVSAVFADSACSYYALYDSHYMDFIKMYKDQIELEVEKPAEERDLQFVALELRYLEKVRTDVKASIAAFVFDEDCPPECRAERIMYKLKVQGPEPESYGLAMMRLHPRQPVESLTAYYRLTATAAR